MTRHLWLKPLPQTVAEVAVVMIVFSAGILLGARVRPTPADWFGFAGALIGAAVTVAGSFYLLDRERARGAREIQALLLALLNDVASACLPFRVANENALQARFGKTAVEQAEEVKDAVGRLQQFASRLQPTTVLMLKASDAIRILEVEPALDGAARLASLYPNDGDFGHLNGIAHELMRRVEQVRALVHGE